MEGSCFMENIVIREGRITDAEAIFLLNKIEMGYAYPIEKTREKLRALLSGRENKILVAVYHGELVGYVHANDYDVIYAPHMKNIMGIAVAGKCKNRGVGRALLSGIEDWAAKTGASGVRLVSGAARTGAHEFYRRCGYGDEKPQINFKKMLPSAVEK
ncbi:MAG: GNAT family N-acetyltransferase [Oscillospiraceae bacterium]